MTLLLHGFWGQPSDWNCMLQKLPLGWPVQALDLYQEGDLSPRWILSEWCQHFAHYVEREYGDEPIDLVGYSMGGRLAFNLVLRDPNRFRRVLLLSTRPYLPPEEHQRRQNWEENWAERFRTATWDELENRWEDEAVFQSSAPLKRRYEHRDLLAESLTRWSVRHHDSRAVTTPERLGTRVDWAFGASDQKYANIAKALQDQPVKGQIFVIENAGHRLIVEAADFVAEWIQAEGLGNGQ